MGNVISDSLTIVMPVVVVLLLGFLTVAYRDPIDLALGLLPCLLNATGTHPLMGRTGSGTNTTGHLPIMGNSRVHLTNPASANP
jgi:predicted RND superfamily exporter protein